MRKLILIFTLLPGLAMANPPMHDQPPHGEFGKPPMHHLVGDGDQLPPLLYNIGLSEDQQREIKNLFKAQQGAISDKFDKERAIKEQLHRLSFSDDYSEDKAKTLIEQSLEIHKDIALQKNRLDNAIFKLLNAEQRDKLKAGMDKIGH
ncbi:Spy/CpxP family protein refolding chaperone [Methylomonas sp. LL1]|uniref:Spy/CpxP family protein refolding chaperone n=1 Tax=Methylomonas sp. LL1 TaxID=2785785 RepID=UPI0018C3F357|nr:Spy/CpxP family protein refolding chaperone [Methylomonas sp. LL1]QPK65141.1 Spy/CpxP family protein refolding chaperone [Methylomonas sp. LL1]